MPKSVAERIQCLPVLRCRTSRTSSPRAIFCW